jgi:hypothetical protein
MRLNVMGFRHGKTASDGSRHREAGATDGCGGNFGRIPATRPGGAAAGFVRRDAGTNRGDSRRGARDGGATPSRLSQIKTGTAGPSQLGRTMPVPAHSRGGKRVLKTLVGKGRRRQPGRRLPDSGGAGAAPGPAGQALGGFWTAHFLMLPRWPPRRATSFWMDATMLGRRGLLSRHLRPRLSLCPFNGAAVSRTRTGHARQNSFWPGAPA